MVWKDLRVRYRYAVMGFLWAIFEPLALMAVLTFIFTFVFRGRVPTTPGVDAPPMAATLLCGLIFWQFMAAGLNSATQSLIDNRELVKKVCFAREIVPMAAVGYPFVNLCIGFVVLLLVHVLLGGGLSLALCFFPVVFALQLAIIVGLGLLLSCGNVHYRDIGYMTNVALVFGFYASPVFYQLEFVTQAANVPEWAAGYYPWIVRAYLLNPMAELLTAYRQILFEQRFPDLWLLAWPSVLAVLSLGSGIFVFRKAGPTLSDHL